MTILKRNLLFGICCPLIFLYSVYGYAGPHDAAPMMSVAKKATKSTQLNEAGIQKKFYDAYESAGSPSIAIFWNRAFSDQVSQWESTERDIVTGEKSINARDLLKKNGDLTQEEINQGFEATDADPSGGNINSYDRLIKGGSKILSATQSEVRIKQNEREGLGETEQFTFSSAYLQPFFAQSVKILDRAAIIRIIERDMVREAGAEMVADIQKIETEALVGYADLLTEILLANDQINYLISVKEVATGRIITSFKSDGKGNGTEKWVSTSSGFQKKMSHKNTTHEQIGKQLAIETMQHLTGVIGEL